MEIDNKKFEQVSKDIDLFTLIIQAKMTILRIAKFHPDALSFLVCELDDFVSKFSK